MMNEMHEEKQREALIRSLGVFELRGLARELGVPSPTTKKREELISLISSRIKEGNTADDLKAQTRGRPFKKLTSIDEIVNNMITDKSEKQFGYDSVLVFMQESKPFIANVSEDLQTFEGIIKAEKEVFSIVDIKKNIKVFIDEALFVRENLQIGMKVKLEAGRVGEEKFYWASSIIEIDENSASSYRPTTFKKSEEIISNINIPFSPSLAKEGRRNAFCFDEDLYETNRFESLYRFCLDKNYKTIVLNVNSSYENQIMFNKLGVKDNFTTQYGEKAFWSVHKVLDVINYANHLLDNGEKVLIFIPDILAVMRKLDEYFDENETVYGYKQQTICMTQKLLSIGRAYENDCSATLIFGYNELDKDDKFLNNDILRISKRI